MTDRAQTVRGIAQALAGEPGALLPILHRVMDELGYVAPQDGAVIADVLNLTEADVEGVVSFYTDFRRTPPPECVVRVCRGEACQANGAEELLRRIRRSRVMDMNGVELQDVFCLGNCVLGPSVTVRGRLHGRMDVDRLEDLVVEGL